MLLPGKENGAQPAHQSGVERFFRLSWGWPASLRIRCSSIHRSSAAAINSSRFDSACRSWSVTSASTPGNFAQLYGVIALRFENLHNGVQDSGGRPAIAVRRRYVHTFAVWSNPVTVSGVTRLLAHLGRCRRDEARTDGSSGRQGRIHYRGGARTGPQPRCSLAARGGQHHRRRHLRGYPGQPLSDGRLGPSSTRRSNSSRPKAARCWARSPTCVTSINQGRGRRRRRALRSARHRACERRNCAGGLSRADRSTKIWPSGKHVVSGESRRGVSRRAKRRSRTCWPATGRCHHLHQFHGRAERVRGLQGGGLGYSASKHGIVGLMRTLANAFAPANIRVNTVHPTAVNTMMAVNPR